MASLPPTPLQTFGASPFSGAELLAPPPMSPGLGADLFGTPPAQVPLENLLSASPLAPPVEEDRPIDKLRPDSALHSSVREKLDAMLNYSAHAMQANYNRWNFMERKVQAFVNEQDYEALLEGSQKGMLPPEPVQIVVPYTYATLHAAATYMSTVLLGRKPVFGLNATRGTAVDNARYTEQALQYNLDESGGHEMLWQGIWDGLNYSFAATTIAWEERSGPIMKMRGSEKVFEDGITYSGNKLAAVDPYAFFPDPRVPLHKCPQQGDFMFHMRETSEMALRDLEKAGMLKWVEEACAMRNSARGEDKPSQRRLRLGAADNSWLTPKNIVGFKQVYEGTVRLVPKDWKLGDKDTSEIWKFTWVKNGQIIQAEPLNMLHGQHPYAVQEPNSLGYDFMSLSMGEMISVFQDILSWLVSSRMENVRSAINNSFIVDPARVELNDIRSTTIGRIIRLKQAAMGLPVQQAIQQLQIVDVTGGHFQDIQTMRMLADTTTGVNDNLRGIQTQGGRRSATEARMSMQAGASRLSQMAVRISSQYMSPMAKQMIMNIQQFMPPEMWIEVTGDTGQMLSQQVKPEMLAGSFNYQVTDGSLPMDKAALVEVWKEILFGIARDPELRQQFRLTEIFKYTAELGGAKNIDAFQAPPPQIAPPGEEPSGQAVGAANPGMPQFM